MPSSSSPPLYVLPEVPKAHSASPPRAQLISAAREEALFMGLPKRCAPQVSRKLRGLAVLLERVHSTRLSHECGAQVPFRDTNLIEALLVTGHDLSQSVVMLLESDAPGRRSAIHCHSSRARHDHA